MKNASLIDFIFIGIGVLLSSLGGIFLKLGPVRVDHSHGALAAVLGAAQEWRIFLGAFLYVIPVAIWIYLLKKIDITYLQPMFALVYVITPIVAINYLSESMPPSRWIGIIIIIIGVSISARA